MSNVVPLSISAVSALLAGAVWWTHRANLKLNLYGRRFDVYSRMLDLFLALSGWNPTELEIATISLKDSPELRQSQRDFYKAVLEAKFLFNDPDIQNQLTQIHNDISHIIEFKRDLVPQTRQGSVDAKPEHEEYIRCLQRLNDSKPSLEQKMSKYLKYKGGFLLPR